MPFNPKSLYIPNGWKVHKITGESRVKRKKFGVSKEVAEFVDIKGPITLGNICDESTQVVELSGITQIGPLKNEIKICSRKNFAGWCDYIDNKVNGTIIHGCNWNSIESYDVPKSAKLEVTVYKLFSSNPVLSIVGPTRSLNADLAPINIQYKVDDKKRKKL